MPLTERDPNISGRTSRASVLSTGSKGVPQKGPHGARNDLLSSAPGVASMLRTSTELGNVGGMGFDASSNLPNVPRAHHRSGATSRMSTGSSHSNSSRRDSRRASAQQNAWPPASSGARHSMTRNSNMPQYIPDTLSPTIMNLPGSSPLIPRSRTSRDGDGRARSMTHASHPNLGLSSNRSYSSLRTNDLIQRPRSPYEGYPQHFRRPGGLRPASPATSDFTDLVSRRPHGAQTFQRRRVPSDISARRDSRSQMVPPPLRTRSPAYYANPKQHSDVPPVPQIPPHHQHRAVQAHIIHKQARGSVSSGSTNQRADSEAPSSDGPSPPTPRDGLSMGTLVTPAGAQIAIGSGLGATKAEETGVLYYDGSEEYFEREDYAMTESDTVATGFRYSVKTILEERPQVETPPKTAGKKEQKEPADVSVPEVEGRAELPASPVPRRITRDLILAALEDSASTKGYADISERSSKNKLGEFPVEQQGDLSTVDTSKEVASSESHHPGGSKDIRFSIVSQGGNSLIDSSTVELAVRYSNSGGSGTVTGTGNGTTEDGMSDLLNGYQRTETEKDIERDVKAAEKDPLDEESPQEKGRHTPKSSDEQSFKSCTDLPDEPCKDSDAKSFRTCKDAVTPERAVSMPISRLPSSNLTKSEPKVQRQVSEMPLSSPPTVLRKKPPIPLRESSFPKVNSQMRTNSMLSSRQGSTVTSISSSVEGSVPHPPAVPPRESSSSKEAQRTTAVASYLLRGFRSGGRFASFGKKSTKSEASIQAGVNDDVSLSDSPRRKQEYSPSQRSRHGPTETIKTPEKPLVKQEAASGKQSVGKKTSKASASLNAATPLRIPEARLAPHHRWLSTPSGPVPEPSSVYSPDHSSSSFKNRVPCSPAELSSSPEQGHSRRDSHSTTHLVWPGRKSLNFRSAKTPESRHQSSEQDDTTTDLRLSSYRQPMVMHYLPDLKEESHEDSSLNTSTGNLKNPSFRFPYGGRSSVRASVDDSVFVGGDLSIKSVRDSKLAQTRGLPSMNFSKMDLLGTFMDILGPRSTRSFDAAAEEREGLFRDGHVRSASDGGVRDKYRSVFAGLEGEERVPDATQTAMDLISFRRKYTVTEIMSDIEKLDVPSVSGLTMRISEMFPAIKRGEKSDVFEEEEIIEHVMEELQEVGGPALKRSSARLRPVPGSPSMLVVEDAVYEELTGREKDGGGRAGAESSVGDPHAGTGSSMRRCRRAALAELEASGPPKLRPRSLSLGDRPTSRLSVRRSQLSLPSTPTTTTDAHPWYNDKNFPWATTTAHSVDISLPAPVVLRASPRPGPSPLRLRLSESSEISPPVSSAMAHPTDGAGEVRGSLRYLYGLANDEVLRNGRPSPPPFDANGFLTGPINVRGGDQSHEAGDRYPTSSLSPPSNVNLRSLQPEPPTRLSDSDDELITTRKRKLSLLPRLSSIRTSYVSHADDRGAQGTEATNRPSQACERASNSHNNHRLTFINASGMSPREFHMERITNGVKGTWAKFKARCNKVKDRLIRRRSSQPAPAAVPAVPAVAAPAWQGTRRDSKME